MNFDLVRRERSALPATALVGALLGNQARAEDFYQGKTINIVVGTEPAPALTSMDAFSAGTCVAIFRAIRTSSCRTCRAPAA